MWGCHKSLMLLGASSWELEPIVHAHAQACERAHAHARAYTCMHAQHAYTQACILPSKSVARGSKSECSLAEPSHRRLQSIWQPCSVAVVLTAVVLTAVHCSVAVHCCVVNSSAKNSYEFYLPSAIVVYVTLLHNIEIDNISIVGCLRPVWLI